MANTTQVPTEQCLPSQIIAYLALNKNENTKFIVPIDSETPVTFGRTSEVENHYGIPGPAHKFAQNQVFSRHIFGVWFENGNICFELITPHNLTFFGKFDPNMISEIGNPSKYNSYNNARNSALCFMMICKVHEIIPYDVSQIIAREVYASRKDSCWSFNMLKHGTTYKFNLTDPIHLWSVGIKIESQPSKLHIMRFELSSASSTEI